MATTNMAVEINFPKGSSTLSIRTEEGITKLIPVLSFRDRRHINLVVQTLLDDNDIAFHGWGVAGVCGRVDSESNFLKFWQLKKGRLPGSKIPLLEPPEDMSKHVDWEMVHPDFQSLKTKKGQNKLWSMPLPFHLILPYKNEGNTLSEAVVTPAFDPEVASTIPVPTACFFWTADPALEHMVKEIKKKNSRVQLGVSSLNDHGELPPFNTEELIKYLVSKNISDYEVVVSDPLLEPLDIASSHSQFRVPLVGEEPAWIMQRRGSLSDKFFEKHSGLPVIIADNVRLAARRHSENKILDHKLQMAIREIKLWQLKSLVHLV